MAAPRLSKRSTKERPLSNHRKHSSGVSGLGSYALGQRANSRVTRILGCLGLVAVTWAVFGQTLAHDFVNFDDHVYVYENPLIVRGLSVEGIIGAFTHAHAPRTWSSRSTRQSRIAATACNKTLRAWYGSGFRPANLCSAQNVVRTSG